MSEEKKKVIIKAEEAMTYCFDELTNYPAEVEEIFHVERDQANSEFFRELEDCAALGKSLILVGDPGVGKTSFMKRILADNARSIHDMFQKNKLLKNYGLIVFHVDCLKDVKMFNPSISNFKKAFIEEYSKKANKIYPCHEVVNIENEINARYQKLVQHILNLEYDKELKHKFIFFIDDIDFCEKELQHEILESLSRFLSSEKVIIVYACRPPSLREIDYHFNLRPKIDVYKKTRHVELKPLDVRYLLSRRLAFLLHEEFTKSFTSRFIDFFRRKDAFIRYINKFGINGERFEEIDYPFTIRQENFMARFSNGDIRIILRIAMQYLHYMLNNIGRLQKNENGGWIVGRDVLIKEFSVKPKENPPIFLDEEKWKIIDLHSEKTISSRDYSMKRGNSLLFNVLEAIALFNDPMNKNFLHILNDLGHSDENIRQAIDYLYWQGIIKENIIMSAGPTLFGKYSDRDNTRYVLTEKGRFYYDEFIEWKQYKNKFGKSQHSVFDLLETIGEDPIHKEVLEFIATICSFSERRKGIYLKVNKQRLFDFFILKYGERYQNINYTDNWDIEKDCFMDISRFTSILLKLKIISDYNIDKRSYYAIKVKKTIDLAANEPNIFIIDDKNKKFVFNENLFNYEEICIFVSENITIIDKKNGDK